MKIFLDTSSLFKLYHQEVGTDELEKMFAQGKKLEFKYAFVVRWKKPDNTRKM